MRRAVVAKRRSKAEPHVIIPLRAPFVDARGMIQNLIDASFTSAAMITSVKGAVRGNHYHKTDYHYCWLQSGGMIYMHRKAGAKTAPRRWAIKPGQMFYTPPMYEHAMVFTADTVWFVFARNNRDMAHYEADTVRVSPLE